MTGKKEMKITRRQLRKVINENIKLLNEAKLDCYSEGEVDAASNRAVELLGFGGEALALFLKEIAVKESGRNSAGLSPGDKGFKIDCFLKKQVGGGPAIGPWQVEPETFEFLKKNWKLEAISNTIFKNAGKGLQSPLSEQNVSMFTNSRSIQALTAALKMIDKMNPRSTEQSQDRENNQAETFIVPSTHKGRADLWKNFYNTSSGAGTSQEYININKANNTSM